MMKIGDKVRFLNEIGGGIVKGFRGKDIVLVEDADGFDIPMPMRECVVIDTDDYNMTRPVTKAAPKKAEEKQVRSSISYPVQENSAALVQTAGICLPSARNAWWRYSECFSGFCTGRY